MGVLTSRLGSLVKWSVPLFLIAVIPVQAQPRAVEFFATGGYVKYANDAGFEGSGAAAGATATLPIVRRFVIEAEAHTSRIEFRNRYRNEPNFYSRFGPIYTTRVTMLAITPVLRFGADRVYAFGGLGPAATIRGRYGTGSLQLRGGLVLSPVRHFVLRGEYVYGTSAKGVKFGAGYRF